MGKSVDSRTGSTLDSFLNEEGLLHAAEVVAMKRVLAWQLQQAMKAKRISKKEMARLLKNSRSQVDRILDPEYVGVSLESVSNMAQALGRRVEVQLLDEGNLKKSITKNLRVRARSASSTQSTRKRVAAA